MSRADIIFPILKAAAKTPLLVGQCVPCIKQNASKIKVKRFELSKNILKYYNTTEYVYISDPEKACRFGDIVLIKKLPENLTKLISHELVKIVFPYGDVTDPITGKKVIWSSYRDDIEKETDAFGRLPSTFDYESAPPRGWTEGTKSFAEKPTYHKYHVFEKEDPYAV